MACWCPTVAELAKKCKLHMFVNEPDEASQQYDFSTEVGG